ncbi:MAG: hypothetical protein HUK40_03510 [Desulfobacter sp.]|nr:hypothetical protein [Desulfobacter sp.]
MSKVMTMKEAVSAHVNSGDFLFIGGYVCRTPFSAIHEIIRQKITDLTITRSNAADDRGRLCQTIYLHLSLPWHLRLGTLLSKVP